MTHHNGMRTGRGPTNWRQLRQRVQGDALVKELCRLFHANPVAIECAMRHGQVHVDGYVMRPEHDHRWTREQLQGRRATINYPNGHPPRAARLYE